MQMLLNSGTSFLQTEHDWIGSQSCADGSHAVGIELEWHKMSQVSNATARRAVSQVRLHCSDANVIKR